MTLWGRQLSKGSWNITYLSQPCWRIFPVFPCCKTVKEYKTAMRNLIYWPLRDVEVILQLQNYFRISQEPINARYIYKLILHIWILITSWEIGLPWVAENLNDEKSTLLQVMAWCRLATRHYLCQGWSRSLSLYGITQPQWADRVTDRGISSNMFHGFFSNNIQKYPYSCCNNVFYMCLRLW